MPATAFPSESQAQASKSQVLGSFANHQEAKMKQEPNQTARQTTIWPMK